MQYTYTANVLRSINAVYARYSNEKNVDTPTFMKGDKYNYGYFFDDHEAIDGSLYFSKKLLSKASNLERRLIIIIPEVRDLIEIYNGRDYKNLKWYLDLKRISFQTNSMLFAFKDTLKKGIDLCKPAPSDLKSDKAPPSGKSKDTTGESGKE